MTHTLNQSQIAVIGGGLAGRLAALALTNQGFKVSLFAPKPKTDDGRSTALLEDSLSFLKKLGLGPALETTGADLKTMRLLDGSDRLVRSPPTDFHSAEMGLDAFGKNILNADLLRAITSKATDYDTFSVIEQSVDRVDLHDSGVTLNIGGRAFDFDAVIGADGVNSIVRQAAAIGERRWEYPQVALVGNFSHSRAHNNISTEFHTRTGPLTTVPMSGKKSSLVWVLGPKEVDDLLIQDNETLSRDLERRMQSLLGAISLEKPLQQFPLKGMVAKQFGTKRCFLVGEAAHQFPPIGAQGFNLGVRDVQALVKALTRSDRNFEKAARAYDRDRRADVLARTAAVDTLNRSVLSDLLPVQLARRFGLSALNNSGTLRGIAMAAGMSAPRQAAPRILQNLQSKARSLFPSQSR